MSYGFIEKVGCDGGNAGSSLLDDNPAEDHPDGLTHGAEVHIAA